MDPGGADDSWLVVISSPSRIIKVEATEHNLGSPLQKANSKAEKGECIGQQSHCGCS
jgi:hypothetical protein